MGHLCTLLTPFTDFTPKPCHVVYVTVIFLATFGVLVISFHPQGYEMVTAYPTNNQSEKDTPKINIGNCLILSADQLANLHKCKIMIDNCYWNTYIGWLKTLFFLTLSNLE